MCYYQLLPEEGRKQQLSWRDPGVSFHPRPAKTKWARSTRRLSDIWRNWYIPKTVRTYQLFLCFLEQEQVATVMNTTIDIPETKRSGAWIYIYIIYIYIYNIYIIYIYIHIQLVDPRDPHGSHVTKIIFSVLCEGPPRHVYRTHQDVQGPYTIHSFVRIWIYMYICATSPKKIEQSFQDVVDDFDI